VRASNFSAASSAWSRHIDSSLRRVVLRNRRRRCRATALYTVARSANGSPDAFSFATFGRIKIDLTAESLADEVRGAVPVGEPPIDPVRIASEEGLLLGPSASFGPEFHGRLDYIDAHRDLLMRAGPHNSLSGFVCDNQIEREADAFAAALLIPRENLDLRLRKRGFLDLRGVIDVARDFQTSVQCAAVRYAQLTGEACYVIVARAGRIFYQTPSDEARAWRVGRVFHFDCQIDHCSQQIAVNRHFAFRTPSPTA